MRAAPGSASRMGGTPTPWRPAPATILFKPPDAWTQLGAKGGSPARGQKGGPSPHLRGLGTEGARQLGEGGLCLPDSPVETAGLCGGGRGRSPTEVLPLPSPPHPPAVGLEASRSQHSPLGPQASPIVPAISPGI